MTPFPTLTSHKIRAVPKMRLNVNSSEEANVNWPKNSSGSVKVFRRKDHTSIRSAAAILFLLAASSFTRGQTPENFKWQFSPTDYTGAIALSHDQSLVGVGVSGGICIYFTGTQLPLREIIPHFGNPQNFIFSSDGRTLAIESISPTQAQRIELWNYETGTYLGAINSKVSTINSFVFSPNGKTLALGGFASSQGVSLVEQWNVSTNSKVSSIKTSAATVASVAYSRFGQYLAVGGQAYTAQWAKVGVLELWNTSTSTLYKNLNVGDLTSVNSVVFPSSGKTVACAGSSGSEGAIGTWHLSDGTLSSPINHILALPSGAVLSPDADQFAVVTLSPASQMGQRYMNAYVSLWNLSNLAYPRVTYYSGCAATGVAFSDDASKIAFAGNAVSWFGTGMGGAMEPSGSFFNVGSTTTGALLYGSSITAYGWWGPESASVKPTFSPSGKYVLGGGNNYSVSGFDSQNGVMNIWNTADGALAAAVPTHISAANFAAAFSTDDKLLAVTNYYSSPGSVLIWDLPSGSLKETLSCSVYPGTLAFSPKSTLLAVAGPAASVGPAAVELWDYSTGKRIATYPTGSNGGINSIAFSADGMTLALGGSYKSTAGSVGILEVWNVVKGRRMFSLATQASVISGVAISPDGKSLAAAGYSSPTGGLNLGSLENWNLTTGTRKAILPLLTNTISVDSVRFSPDGSALYAASSGETGAVQVFNWANSLFLGYYTTGSGPYFGLSQDGGTAAICNSNIGIAVAKLPNLVSVPLKSIKLSQSSIPTWTTTTATVTLESPAPSGGVTLGIQTGLGYWYTFQLPTTLVIPAGATSGTFSVMSEDENSVTTVPITVISGPNSLTTSLTISPPVLTSFTLSASNVVGGNAVSGTVTMANPPGLFDTYVWLTSSNPSVVVVPYLADFPAGVKTVSFQVGTVLVKTPQVVTITATLGTATKTVQLTVNPPG